MKIMAVDNEEIALEGLLRTIKTAIPKAELFSSTDSKKAFLLAEENRPDIAFLDIEMPGMSGLELAKKIKEEVDPKINIIFTTGYSEYIEEAFTKLRVSGYLLKPVTEEMILTEIENLRYPVEIRGACRVRVRAFGSFEVYIDDKPVDFHYNKTKELCAYLIDHGGMCSIAELQENLWEENDSFSDHRSYLQNLISDLIKTFSKNGCKDAVIRKYGAVGMDPTQLDCDYYSYRDGNPAAVNAFRGEYMSQYSWAENTLGSLVFRKW